MTTNGDYIDSYRFNANFTVIMTTESFYYNEGTDFHMAAGTILIGSNQFWSYFSFKSNTSDTFPNKKFRRSSQNTQVMSTYYPGGWQYYIAGIVKESGDRYL